jgi:hypothetical protein
MNAKHTTTFFITVTMALMIAACGAAKESETIPEPPVPAAPAQAPETGGRPDLQGQGLGFEGGAPDGDPKGFMTIITEATGLSIEALQEESVGGATMAEIITANGGDVETVRAKLIEAMSEMPNAGEGDIEQRVSDLLNNPLPMRSGEGGPGGLRDDQ